jgi:hypothetical protein
LQKLFITAAQHSPSEYQPSLPAYPESGGSRARLEDFARSPSLSSRSANSPATPSPQRYSCFFCSFGNDVTDADAVHDNLLEVSRIASHLPFSSDNLYEHKNPWHTVGVILGLSPASQGSSRTSVDGTSSVSHKTTISTLSGEAPISRLGLFIHSLSPRGSSPSASGRFNSNQDEDLGKCLPCFESSPSSNSSYSVLRRDEHKPVQVTVDTGKPTLPLRFDASVSKVDGSVMTSPGQVSPGRISRLSKPVDISSSVLMLAEPKMTATLADFTDAEQIRNDPYDRISSSLTRTGTEERLRTTESFTPLELRFEELDGVFQGPCLFSED